MRAIILMCLVALIALSFPLQAVSRPDFDYIFMRLVHNRCVYKQYNDKIRRPLDCGQWIDLFFKRSDVNTKIYKENGYLINSVLDYFHKGNPTPSDYETLAGKVIAMERRDVADPFLVEEFLEVVLPYFEKDKKAGLSDLRAAVYRYYAENQRQIAMLSSESASGKAWVYYNKVVDMADSLSEKGMPELVKTLAQLSSVVWFRAGYTTVECTRRMKDKLAFLMEDNRITGILDSATLCYARNAVSEFDRRLIRNGYLPDSTLLPRQEADSMIMAQISEYEAMKQPTVKDVCVLNLLKWYKGQIDADSALLAASEYYRENTTYPRHIDAVQLGRLHTPLLDLIFFNDISAIPIEKKRANAAYFCDEIVKLFQRIEDNQSDIRYVAIQMKFLKYGRLLRYMTSEQKIHFINRLMVCTQVSTVAHSVHVAALADIIIDGVMKYKPYLLPMDVDPGEGGWRRFMHEAALYHDFGKNSIISVITNEYRPSTSHERELIRKHPQTGVVMLGIDSALVKYHDTTLGHHRWYDGSGGYPAYFDNTSSPVRIIIDILTIADCLEAATDQFGRNYSPVKRFENAILEFGAQRGSRYNPEILDVIENQEDVYQALKSVVDNDWHKIYYDIYEMYIEE